MSSVCVVLWHGSLSLSLLFFQAWGRKTLVTTRKILGFTQNAGWRILCLYAAAVECFLCFWATEWPLLPWRPLPSPWFNFFNLTKQQTKASSHFCDTYLQQTHVPTLNPQSPAWEHLPEKLSHEVVIKKKPHSNSDTYHLMNTKYRHPVMTTHPNDKADCGSGSNIQKVKLSPNFCCCLFY